MATLQESVLQAIPRRRVKLTPKAYLRLTPEERANITSIRLIPPDLGRRDFGGLDVIYRRPVYHVHPCA